jgi:hypothetical protein
MRTKKVITASFLSTKMNGKNEINKWREQKRTYNPPFKFQLEILIETLIKKKKKYIRLFSE